VIIALWDVQQQAPLNRYQLKRILDAREQDLVQPQPPVTLQELEQYAESTASQLLYLGLAAAGEAPDRWNLVHMKVCSCVGCISLMGHIFWITIHGCAHIYIIEREGALKAALSLLSVVAQWLGQACNKDKQETPYLPFPGN
jgi:hypothetical protein